jgi:hypothetical protein
MADNTVVHLAENSPEQVAYRLMRDIKPKPPLGQGPEGKDEILDLYAECLRAVRGERLPKIQ